LLGEQYDEQVDAIIRNASRLKEIIESLTSVNNYEPAGRSSDRAKYPSRASSRMFPPLARWRKKGVALKSKKPPGNDLWVDIDAARSPSS
jgi:hypothetical protein